MGRRLVDADDFRKFLWALTMAGAPYGDVMELLNRQPTAYDPDKVVEQLEDYNMWRELLIYELTHREREIIKKAIEIVKGGGINDEKGVMQNV